LDGFHLRRARRGIRPVRLGRAARAVRRARRARPLHRGASARHVHALARGHVVADVLRLRVRQRGNGVGALARRRRAVAARQRGWHFDGDPDGGFRYPRFDSRSQEIARAMSIATRDTAARIAAALRAMALGVTAAFMAGSAQAATEAEIAAARDAFVARMVSEHKFDRDEVVELLEGATIVQSVLDAISRPAERVVPWHEYRNIFMTEARIAGGVKFWEDHRDAVLRASEKHKVAPEMIVGIIGVETLYGQRMGNYTVLDSLATLAFAYPPRARFFAGELEQFLLLVREEDVDVTKALGSYAGAMGAGQFIPSSYRAYAVDGNGDGKRN